MTPAARAATIAPVRRRNPHRPLCTIELIAEGHASRCPGKECAFWENGCALSRIEAEIDWHPEVAALLLELRRVIEAGREVELSEAQALLHHSLTASAE